MVEHVLILTLDWFFLNRLLDYLSRCVEDLNDVRMFIGNGLRMWLTFFRNWRVNIPFLRELRFVAKFMIMIKIDLGFVKLSQ